VRLDLCKNNSAVTKEKLIDPHLECAGEKPAGTARCLGFGMNKLNQNIIIRS
jgi:hypothetical protein